MKQEQLERIQPTIFQHLIQILQEKRLSHAYLFSGNNASFEMALFLTQAIFCSEKQEELPCGKCRNCRLVEEQEFPDMTVIAPQGNIIKTDTMKELVQNLSQSGFESPQQVVIIRDSEKMHVNAANALLKTIEEPQAGRYLFLLTNQEEALLPTIKSRTQRIYFPKNTQAIKEELEAQGYFATHAGMIAQLVDNLEEASELASKKTLVNQLGILKQCLVALEEKTPRSYLLLQSLFPLVVEKSEQARIFDMLAILLAEDLYQKWRRDSLEILNSSKKMWQSNVSFQNSLDYWMLQTMKSRKN